MCKINRDPKRHQICQNKTKNRERRKKEGKKQKEKEKRDEIWCNYKKITIRESRCYSDDRLFLAYKGKLETKRQFFNRKKQIEESFYFLQNFHVQIFDTYNELRFYICTLA